MDVKITNKQKSYYDNYDSIFRKVKKCGANCECVCDNGRDNPYLLSNLFLHNLFVTNFNESKESKKIIT